MYRTKSVFRSVLWNEIRNFPVNTGDLDVFYGPNIRTRCRRGDSDKGPDILVVSLMTIFIRSHTYNVNVCEHC